MRLDPPRIRAPSGGGLDDLRPVAEIVVPAYNEEAVLADHLRELCRVVEADLGFDWHVLVVNDGSRDRTGAIANDFARDRPHVTVVHHSTNRGLGAAIRTGFAHARGDVVVVLDADLSYRAEAVVPLAERVVGDELDIVALSPYGAGGRSSNVPGLRLLLSRGANRLLAASLGSALTTPTAMVRAYSRRAYRSVRFAADGPEANLEIVASALRLGLRISELPGHLEWHGDTAARARRTSARALARQTLAVLLWSARLRVARARAVRVASLPDRKNDRNWRPAG